MLNLFVGILGLLANLFILGFVSPSLVSSTVSLFVFVGFTLALTSVIGVIFAIFLIADGLVTITTKTEDKNGENT